MALSSQVTQTLAFVANFSFGAVTSAVAKVSTVDANNVLPGPLFCFVQSFRLVQLETGVFILRYTSLTLL